MRLTRPCARACLFLCVCASWKWWTHSASWLRCKVLSWWKLSLPLTPPVNVQTHSGSSASSGVRRLHWTLHHNPDCGGVQQHPEQILVVDEFDFDFLERVWRRTDRSSVFLHPPPLPRYLWSCLIYFSITPEFLFDNAHHSCSYLIFWLDKTSSSILTATIEKQLQGEGYTNCSFVSLKTFFFYIEQENILFITTVIAVIWILS